MSEENEIIEGFIMSIGSGPDETYDFVPTPTYSGTRIMSQKGIEGSQQSEEEIATGNIGSLTSSSKQYIEPPYDPQTMADFLEVDETHFRAVKAKVGDIVGKPYKIKSFTRVLRSKSEAKSLKLDPEDYILATDHRTEVRGLEKFIEKCNPQKGFLGTIQCAAMDYEAIGWAALEVIRSMDKKVARIAHVPAARIRVLKGHKGFVELAESTNVPYRYYQNFGEKVGKRGKSPITGKKEFIPFEPDQDSYSDSDLEWNLIDRKTGDPTRSINNAANEILFIPKVHCNTIYYGYSDIVPALKSLIMNTFIREHQIQFFENHAVPRYAVIVTGGTLSDDLKKGLLEYFTKEVRGQAHKTLVLCLPSNPNKEIKVEFKQLDSDRKEADFLESEKHNQKNIQVAHGTPPAILGVAEHSELGSGKGLSQAELYKDRIVLPSQYFWEEKLYELTSKGLGLIHAYIGFSPFDVRDRFTQMQVLTGYVQNGIFDINDCLEELDKPPTEGGEVRFIKGDKFVKIKDLLTNDSTIAQPKEPSEGPQNGNNSQDDTEVENDN